MTADLRSAARRAILWGVEATGPALRLTAGVMSRPIQEVAMSDSTSAFPQKQCSVCGRLLPDNDQYFPKTGCINDKCKDCRVRGKSPSLVFYTLLDGSEVIDPCYKRCLQCQRILPATTEFFAANPPGLYGLRPQCRHCTSKISPEERAEMSRRQTERLSHKQYLRQKRATIADAATRGMKICVHCGNEYPSTAEYFHRDKGQKDGFARRCKHCIHDYHIKNSDRLIKQNRQWQLKNPDKTRLYHRRWRANNITYQSDRRSAVENLPYDFSWDDWLRCLNHWNYRCAVCGRPDGFWHKLVRDHWIPVTDPRSDNPGTVPWNIIPLCHGIDGCNNAKSNHNPIEWLIRKLGKRKAKQKLAEIEAYFEAVRR